MNLDLQRQLRGRSLDELATREMISDILLELKDTDKFDTLITLLDNYIPDFMDSLSISGVIKVCEMVCDKNSYDIQSLDSYEHSYMNFRVVEKIYEVIRKPVRLNITSKNGVQLNINDIETFESVFLRLKDYINIDVIDSGVYIIDNNYNKRNVSLDHIIYSTTPRNSICFSIDFIVSDVRLVK